MVVLPLAPTAVSCHTTRLTPHPLHFAHGRVLLIGEASPEKKAYPGADEADINPATKHRWDRAGACFCINFLLWLLWLWLLLWLCLLLCCVVWLLFVFVSVVIIDNGCDCDCSCGCSYNCSCNGGLRFCCDCALVHPLPWGIVPHSISRRAHVRVAADSEPRRSCG